jgi:hypothetical protein
LTAAAAAAAAAAPYLYHFGVIGSRMLCVSLSNRACNNNAFKLIPLLYELAILEHGV